ncbi:hypothetical protein F5148DRAFT_1252355 [Russula earlei]|uniref:Uncharacterized protein n=1 Tax=Russula earlei TaxID=71964 RepID=A0ACC0TUE5_9AGAM|nr:hypothetical protein F5148DRAFT_1252355 [Russula earlei]
MTSSNTDQSSSSSNAAARDGPVNLRIPDATRRSVVGSEEATVPRRRWCWCWCSASADVEEGEEDEVQRRGSVARAAAAAGDAWAWGGEGERKSAGRDEWTVEGSDSADPGAAWREEDGVVLAWSPEGPEGRIVTIESGAFVDPAAAGARPSTGVMQIFYYSCDLFRTVRKGLRWYLGEQQRGRDEVHVLLTLTLAMNDKRDQ